MSESLKKEEELEEAKEEADLNSKVDELEEKVRVLEHIIKSHNALIRVIEEDCKKLRTNADTLETKVSSLSESRTISTEENLSRRILQLEDWATRVSTSFWSSDVSTAFSTLVSNLKNYTRPFF